ncbi:MICOS complex subunit MIC26 [Python bivittatus]|uniref:MICOS complex subunit n=1 Tax=Python bivittatus TaxID=176946 RepID=A0A9F2R653_PYTBI|nr:MICOS complex subunit MIC26 [Python bivittatus]XP_007436710.1 MICOS complex subunit MIC26 [Python bivittatus]XP_025027961.1 MICOS complex subunit MIC26 [Python bivittatus]
MFKIRQLIAAPGILNLLAVQVYADSLENESSKKNLLKVDELSLYTSPTPKSKYVEDPQSQLEEGICHLRHSLEPYAAWVQDYTGKVTPRVEKACEYVKESYEMIKTPPPGFYPRLGVIGFAGVVGLFLARGSKIKRLVYPISFMGIGTALYYPQQTVAVAKVTGFRIYDWSLQAYISLESLWKDSSKKKKSAKASSKSDAESDKALKVQEERPIK